MEQAAEAPFVFKKKKRLNIDEPRYPQDTFMGRFRHFAGITDWRNGLVPDKQLYEAKDLLDQYR